MPFDIGELCQKNRSAKREMPVKNQENKPAVISFLALAVSACSCSLASSISNELEKSETVNKENSLEDRKKNSHTAIVNWKRHSRVYCSPSTSTADGKAGGGRERARELLSLKLLSRRRIPCFFVHRLPFDAAVILVRLFICHYACCVSKT